MRRNRLPASAGEAQRTPGQTPAGLSQRLDHFADQSRQETRLLYLQAEKRDPESSGTARRMPGRPHLFREGRHFRLQQISGAALALSRALGGSMLEFWHEPQSPALRASPVLRSGAFAGAEIALPEAVARHAVTVLRLQAATR